MPETTRVVEYEQGGFQARVVVATATVRMGIERQALQDAAQKTQGDEPPRIGLLRLLTWPDLVAATVEGVIDGRPAYDITFDEWLDLPEPFVVQWEDAVYALNSHWMPSPPPLPLKGGATTNGTN
jgi:hypothetical protein